MTITALLTAGLMAALQQQTAPPPPALTIARLAAPPALQDFLSMDPPPSAIQGMTRVADFVQRWPRDGAPEVMKTVAYLGYTDDALHVVFLAFDPSPAALRAHLIRREDVFVVNDDEVELRLDTYGDRRESYYFVSNPLGVQLDAAWPEAGGQYDESFDLVWHSTGQRTARGFVVHMAIPFKSLRFRPDQELSWGVYLGRWIPRTGEWSFWPRISLRQQSYLTQMARLEGLRDLARGKGVQVIPYASWRSFKAIDARSAAGPRVVRDRADPRLGLDAKLVVRDAMVVDATFNPDFSQVESDAPQITTNQRFEVFFPEKRPFFLENAGFLQTPVNLFFTRRLADPQVGARLTGRAGGWTMGALAADDRGPGRTVDDADADFGARAYAGVVRISRALSGQSSVGGIVTTRSFRGRDNTVFGVDSKLRFARVWGVDAQWIGSRVQSAGADSGSAYAAALSWNGRWVSSRTTIEGRSPRFVTDLGFVPRTDMHQLSQTFGYTFRPGKALSDWTPDLTAERLWSYDGTALDWRLRPGVSMNFKRSTTLSGFAESAGIGLRPGDAANVAAFSSLRPYAAGVSAGSSPTPVFGGSVQFTAGRAVNFTPAPGQPPSLARMTNTRARLSLRPLTGLRVEGTLLRATLADDAAAARIFTTTVFRTQVAWQLTREWSVRVITQHDRTAVDPTQTATAPRQNVNADVLITRLVNPWTALYFGYNSNARDRDLVEDAAGTRRFQPAPRLVNDGWQLFVKWSQLLRW